MENILITAETYYIIHIYILQIFYIIQIFLLYYITKENNQLKKQLKETEELLQDIVKENYVEISNINQ